MLTPVIGMIKQLMKKIPCIIIKHFSHLSELLSPLMERPTKKFESTIILSVHPFFAVFSAGRCSGAAQCSSAPEPEANTSWTIPPEKRRSRTAPGKRPRQARTGVSEHSGRWHFSRTPAQTAALPHPHTARTGCG